MLALAAATLVVCAPGYPGNTAEAQPAMDALARSLARAAHMPEGSLAALYEETEPGCMRRLAQPDEIAAAVAFFASDDAAFITGQTLSVNGGLTML